MNDWDAIDDTRDQRKPDRGESRGTLITEIDRLRDQLRPYAEARGWLADEDVCRAIT